MIRLRALILIITVGGVLTIRSAELSNSVDKAVVKLGSPTEARLRIGGQDQARVCSEAWHGPPTTHLMMMA